MHSKVLFFFHPITLGLAAYLLYLGITLTRDGYTRTIGAMMCAELGIFLTLRRVSINYEFVTDYSVTSGLVSVFLMVGATVALLVCLFVPIESGRAVGSHHKELVMCAVFTVVHLACYLGHYVLRRLFAPEWEWNFKQEGGYPPTANMDYYHREERRPVARKREQRRGANRRGGFGGF